MTTAPRDPSPADLRMNLAPERVDALAVELHRFQCVPICHPDPHRGDPRHADAHRAAARYLLGVLRDRHHLVLLTDPAHAG